MSSRSIRARALPLALLTAVLAASACGPIKIDVSPIPTPKPSGGANATPTPGESVLPSPGGTAKPSATPKPSAGPTGTPDPNGTPIPTDTTDPNATVDPNATPTPLGSVDPNMSPTPTPSGVSTFGTPKPWPSAVDLPGGTPVQGEVYEVKRDAGKPTDVAVDDKGVAWIALGQFNVSSSDPPKGELVRMDKDGTPLQVLTLEGNPKRVEAAPGGGVWVFMDVKGTNSGMVTPAVVRLSADAKVLSRLDLGYGGGGSSGNEGIRLVNGPGGNLWVKSGQSWSGAQVYKIAPGGGLLGTYKDETSGSYGGYGGLGVDGEGYGWLNNGGTSTDSVRILRIAPNMTKSKDFAPGVDHGAYETAATADRVWLAFQKEIAVWKLDGTRDFGIPTGYPVLQMRPDGAGGMWALTSTGGYDSHSNSVIHFDAKGEPSGSFAVGASVRGYGVGGDGAIWAANYDAATVTRVPTR